MTDPAPLDPDEVACPRCHAAAAIECRRPDGSKSNHVHAARRAAAVKLSSPNPTQPADKPKRKSPATPEGRRKAAATQAQNRRRRRAEIAAEIEAARAKAEAEATADEARRLTEDAAAYTRDRAALRRKALDAADASVVALLESLRDRRRVRLDEHGKPRTIKVELFDPRTKLPAFGPDGQRLLADEADEVGAVDEGQIERLAKVWTATLGALRLEEGKPTGIFEQTGAGGVADVLGDAGVDELVAWASKNLPGDTGPT